MKKSIARFLAIGALSLNAWAAGPAVPAPKADLAKGEAAYTAACVACHAATGNSTMAANPRLSGQHASYLNKQLLDFKAGHRENATMKGMVANLSPDDMRNIAAWLASQKPGTDAARNKDLVMLGEKIYRGGIQDRQIPACAGCHSPNGAGIPAKYPRVSGQHAEYAAVQLVAFRDGVRKNSTEMRDIAAKLNDREIKAVADYMAGLR